MDKILGYSFKSLFHFFFTSVAGYCYIDVLKFTLPFTELQILDLKTTGSLIVVVITGIYWLSRLIILIIEIPHNKEERRIKKRILELKRQNEIHDLEEKERKKQLEELFKNDI